MIKLFAFILFSLPSFLFAQQRKAFKIIGHSVFYNNQQLAIQGGVLSTSNEYNDFNFVNDKIDTVNNSFKIVRMLHNQFTINGLLKYPHPFFVSYYDAEKNRGSNSNIFFIDDGIVNIEINNLSTNKNLGNHLNSKSNREYQLLKKLCSNSVDTLSGEIHNLKDKQKILQEYINRNPNSYVALWDIVIDYAIEKNYRTDSDLRSLLKNTQLFSPTIKKTSTYKALVNNITENLELTKDKIFPNIPLDSIEVVEDKIFPNLPLNSVDSLIPLIKKNKFTLLDFWFSGCKPCIAQFPSYKITYDQNKSKGFEIIGISVDRKVDEANWRSTIKKFDLNWLQYLDKNGVIAQKLNITSFPTNFLLDNDGKIIMKNISLENLGFFLQKNLNF